MLYVRSGVLPALVGLALTGAALVAALGSVPESACDYDSDPSGAAVGLPTAASIAGWLGFGLTVGAAVLSIRARDRRLRVPVFLCGVFVIVLDVILLGVDFVAYSCWH